MSSVKKAPDAWMIQRRQNLPFSQEAVAAIGSIGSATDEFDGYGLIYFPIGAFGQKDGSHAALAQETHQPVAATHVSSGWRNSGRHQNFRCDFGDAFGPGVAL